MQTRIIQDRWNGDRWQAQYKENADYPWADIGDGKETRREAEAALAEFKEHQKSQGQA